MATSYRMIDVDTHVTEPADLWTSRVPARLRDQVPYIDTDRKGRQAWYLQGQRIASVGFSAVAGWKEPLSGGGPLTMEQVHPASYDAHERLRYMDSEGIWAMVLYPNVGGFGSQGFLKLGDPELMLACVQAYNDFQAEWASADARRLLPVTATPFWDIEATVTEVLRGYELGHRGVLFTGEPESFGQPFLGDHHWDPLWAIAQELGMPISFHIGSGDFEKAFSPERIRTYGFQAAYARVSTNLFLGNGFHLCDLLLSGVLPRFPELQFVSVESGIGWVPFLLEAIDYQFHEADVRGARPEFELLPSEYFARQVFACYWFEQVGPQRLIDCIGADRILIETDFPHPTCLYGNVWERIDSGLANQAEDVRRKILWDNAQKLYRVDGPTVAELDALAARV
jgi:predicted TIM-barrel fold metal-dependent hydrolase